MMVTTVRGKFDVVEGALEFDEAEPTNSRGEIRASAASLSTGEQKRDDHLHSADFLDAEHRPWVVTRATRIERLGDRYRVQVDLTIQDQTRPVAFDGEFLGFYPAMSGSGRRAGFHFDAKLSREDWGLTWNMALEAGGWLVGDEIRLEVESPRMRRRPSWPARRRRRPMPHVGMHAFAATGGLDDVWTD
jgi:polyisoprenoid-binding protein YceI